MEMEQEQENEASLEKGRVCSWAVTAPPASLSESSLLCGMPVLYQQSSICSLLFVATPQHSGGDSSFGAGRFKRNSLSIPTQLLMPDGGIALGMPPSSLVAGSGTAVGGASGRAEGGDTEESRMSALRSSELAVLLSESPESQIKSRRSRLLLLLAILLSLQYISVFAILQGKDAPPIFLPRLLVKEVIAQDALYRARLVLTGPPHHYGVLRHNFYIVTLCLCLLLPLVLFVAVVEQKRQTEARQSPGGRRLRFRSLVPPTGLSIAVVVFTSLMLVHSIFIVRTYFDVVVFVLFLAIRYTLNRLNFTCFSPHLLLTKAGNNL